METVLVILLAPILIPVIFELVKMPKYGGSGRRGRRRKRR